MTWQYINGNLVCSDGDKHYLGGSEVELSEEELDNLKCPMCNKKQTKEGYDACLGFIQGVEYICCGHGIEDQFYIVMKEAPLELAMHAGISRTENMVAIIEHTL